MTANKTIDFLVSNFERKSFSIAIMYKNEQKELGRSD